MPPNPIVAVDGSNTCPNSDLLCTPTHELKCHLTL